MLLFVAYFFLISLVLSIAANSRPLRETALGRWWRSRGVRLALAAGGVVAGLILAGSGLPRRDWLDISLGLLVAAIFARDWVTLQRLSRR